MSRRVHPPATDGSTAVAAIGRASYPMLGGTLQAMAYTSGKTILSEAGRSQIH